MNNIVVSRANGGVLSWQFLWLQCSIHVLIIAVVLAGHGNRRSRWEPVIRHMTNLSLKISFSVCVCVCMYMYACLYCRGKGLGLRLGDGLILQLIYALFKSGTNGA